jgi:hypothetical protein
MPLCTCKKCLNITDGRGKEVHRTTILRHMNINQMNQKLEEEYQNLYPDKDDDFMQTEEEEFEQNNNDLNENISLQSNYDNEEAGLHNDNENLIFHDGYEEEEISFLDFHDNDEEMLTYISEDFCDENEIENDDFRDDDSEFDDELLLQHIKEMKGETEDETEGEIEGKAEKGKFFFRLYNIILLINTK